MCSNKNVHDMSASVAQRKVIYYQGEKNPGFTQGRNPRGGKNTGQQEGCTYSHDPDT